MPLARPRPISIPPLDLPGDLTVPADPWGLVIFAHGSGSSRHSPRNRQVAGALAQAGLATLLFDLLTEPEALDRNNVFDIPLLAHRLLQAIDWAQASSDLKDLPVGLFGASTGAAAALQAAAARPDIVAAVVSRGGRPDLANHGLDKVIAPTLLIVGGADDIVLELNRQARRLMRASCELRIVPGATHLFEEPGALEAVVRLSLDWFGQHLRPAGPA